MSSHCTLGVSSPGFFGNYYNSQRFNRARQRILGFPFEDSNPGIPFHPRKGLCSRNPGSFFAVKSPTPGILRTPIPPPVISRFPFSVSARKLLFYFLYLIKILKINPNITEEKLRKFHLTMKSFSSLSRQMCG